MGGSELKHTTRMLISGAGLAALGALTQLLFVITKLPVIHWSSLWGGIFASVVTVFLCILLRGRLQRPV